MATVGNLFVKIGASTGGLEKGVANAKHGIEGFAHAVTNFAKEIPGIGGLVHPLEKIWEAVGKATDRTHQQAEATAKAAAEADKYAKAVKNVEQTGNALNSARGEFFGWTDAIAQAKQYNKMLDAVAAAQGRVDEATKRTAQAAEQYKAAQGAVGKASNEEAMAKAVQHEADALVRLNAEMAELEKHRAAVERRSGKAAGLRQDIENSTGGRASFDKGTGKANMAGLGEGAKASADKLGLAESAANNARQALQGMGAAGDVAGNLLTKLGPAATIIAGIGLAAWKASKELFEFVAGQAKIAHEMHTTAVALGTTASGFKMLTDKYHELGVGSDTIRGSMMKLEATIGAAANGSEEAQEKFARMGLDATALQAMDTSDAFSAVIEKISHMGSQAEKIKALRDLMGRGAGGLAGAANASEEALAGAEERARKLAIPEEMIHSLGEVSIAIEAMEGAFAKVKMIVADKLGPIFKSFADSWFEFMASDTSGLETGMNGIAAVLALAYDIVAGIMNAVAAVWNLIMAVGELLNGVLMAALGGVMHGVALLVDGWAYLTGSGGDLAKGLHEWGDTAVEMAKDLAHGAGEDLKEGMQRGIDAVVPDAFIGSLHKGLHDAEGSAHGVAKALHGKDADAHERYGPNSEKAKKFQEDISKVQQRINEGSMGKNEAKAKEFVEKHKDYLMSQGGTERMEQAKQEYLQLLKQADAIEEANKKLEERKSIMEDLQKSADTALMTEEQKVLYELQQKGATEEELKKAKELQKLASERGELKKNMDKWADFMKELGTKATEAGETREQTIRRMAEAAGKVGPALEEAVKGAMDMEAKVKAGEKQKQAREASVKTLEDMRDELRKKQIGDKAFAREQFMKGVTDKKQVEEYDRLAKQIDQNNATPVFQDMDTALGAFKVAQLGGGTGMEKDPMPALAEEGNGFLEVIAKNTQWMAGVMS